ncbi:transposase [Streptomyces sp. NPDC002540]
MTITVTAASVSDRDAGRDLLKALRERHRHIRLVWADSGYTGWLVSFAHAALALALTVVKRSDDTTGFTVLPRRWCVERTFAWLIRSRRLARDYETRIDSAQGYLLHYLLPSPGRRAFVQVTMPVEAWSGC